MYYEVSASPHYNHFISEDISFKDDVDVIFLPDFFLSCLPIVSRELKGLPYWKKLREEEFTEFQNWLKDNNIDLGSLDELIYKREQNLKIYIIRF
jgi:hypothetical protein